MSKICWDWYPSSVANCCEVHTEPESSLNQMRLPSGIMGIIIGKKFGGTPPLLDRNHPVDVSRLSCENVPSVPRTFCPIYVELHRHQVGTSRVSLGLAPKPSPRDTSGTYRSPMPLCVFCLSVFFFSLILTGWPRNRNRQPEPKAEPEEPELVLHEPKL